MAETSSKKLSFTALKRIPKVNSPRAISHFESIFFDALWIITESGTSRISFSSSFRLAARPYSTLSASLKTKSPKPNSFFIYSYNLSINVFERFLRKPTPSSFATDAMLSCEDCNRTGILLLSALMNFTRSIPASSFSCSGESPLCSVKPTSEMTPSMFFLYFSYKATASS